MHERAMSESDFSLALQGSQSVILADLFRVFIQIYSGLSHRVHLY